MPRPRSGIIRNGLSIYAGELGLLMPGRLAPVGHRGPDKSVFGVRDVVMNSQEYIQGRGAVVLLAPKFLPARSDPAYTDVRFQWNIRPARPQSPRTRPADGGGVGLTPHEAQDSLDLIAQVCLLFAGSGLSEA